MPAYDTTRAFLPVARRRLETEFPGQRVVTLLGQRCAEWPQRWAAGFVVLPFFSKDALLHLLAERGVGKDLAFELTNRMRRGKGARALEQWFTKDSSAVPPERFSDGGNTFLPENIWQDVARVRSLPIQAVALSQILRGSILACYQRLAPEAYEEALEKYSVTGHREAKAVASFGGGREVLDAFTQRGMSAPHGIFVIGVGASGAAAVQKFSKKEIIAEDVCDPELSEARQQYGGVANRYLHFLTLGEEKGNDVQEIQSDLVFLLVNLEEEGETGLAQALSLAGKARELGALVLALRLPRRKTRQRAERNGWPPSEGKRTDVFCFHLLTPMMVLMLGGFCRRRRHFMSSWRNLSASSLRHRR